MTWKHLWILAAISIGLGGAPAHADLPRSEPEEVPPGLVTIHGPGAGVHSPLGEVPAWDGLATSVENPGMMDRFYVHAYRFAQDANLHSGAMPETWYGPGRSFMWDQQYRSNAPQLESLLRSALGRAALEEVLHQATGDEQGWLLEPVTENERIARRLRPGLDGGLSLRTTGLGGHFSYNLGSLSLGTGYSTEAGRLQPLRLSHPFLEEDLRGEVGIDSSGNAWLILNARW